MPLLFPLAVQTPYVFDRAQARSVRVESLGIVRSDPVEAQMARGESLEGGPWEEVQADKDGWFSGRAFSGGYVRLTMPATAAKTVLLEAQGASFAYVNGEPRVGDVYSAGYVSLPVRLKQGTNEIVMRVQRGRLRVALVELPKPVSLDSRDATLPDRVKGSRVAQWGALVVRNASDVALTGLRLVAAGPGSRTETTALGPVPAFGVRKVGFKIGAGEGTDVTLRLEQAGKVLDSTKVTLRLRTPKETRKVTFVSAIDGAVQYYGLNPAQTANPSSLILSLHGASVEALGQAEAYGPKSWANLVAATNRRPFGYDWEDWGRIDTLEVLELAKATYPHDPARVYLTGHSMGGHGTWHLGVLYPDRFAAIGPSAGWISSFTYAGSRRVEGTSTIQDVLRRAGNVGDTAAMATNLKPVGVYILHGDADDNVPVTEARKMAENLKPFHHNYQLVEVPGQNHWWDLSDETGADAVDYGPMMEYLARHVIPSSPQVREVDFITFNPEVSATCHWATVVQQTKPFAASRIQLRMDANGNRFLGSTENVARLSLSTEGLAAGPKVKFELDGQKFETAKTPQIELSRGPRGTWGISASALAGEKNPHRGGGFRSAFNHRFTFVYGTKGTAEENAWAIAKARYDAETWWYRGNGSVDVVPDRDFDARKEPDRSVILYGNADTNGAWSSLLGSSPIQVRRGGLNIGTRTFSGGDLSCLFLRPRPGSNVASVGVVGGTGILGMRTNNNLPYLQPMLGVPDFVVMGTDALSAGIIGVRAAGYFGNDWSLEAGDVGFRD